MGNVLSFSEKPESRSPDPERAELVYTRLHVIQKAIEEATPAAAQVLPEMQEQPITPEQTPAQLYNFPETQEEYRDARAA